MTPFAAALAKANAAARAANGEPLTIRPVTKARYKSALADASREQRSVIGIFLNGPDRTKINDSQVGRELNTQFVVAPTAAIVHAEVLMVDGKLVMPREGDQLTRDEYPGQAYEITAIDPNGGGDFIFRLVKVDP